MTIPFALCSAPCRARLCTTVIAGLAGLGMAACGSDDDDPMMMNPPTDPPATYTFESRFESGVSSVSYSGQTKRHLLIRAIGDYLANLTDQDFPAPQPGAVVEALDFFYLFKDRGADPADPLDVDVGPLSTRQTTWGDLGSLASLQEKMPEVDAGFTGSVVGWGDDSLAPEEVLRDMFRRVEDLVFARVGGAIPRDPNGVNIPVPFVSAEGHDYRQLILKYLLGAVALSQGADDYLDDDIDGKGLLSDNTRAVENRPYSALEHVWDEGFGYFGAARNYGDYTDDEIASAGGRNGWQGAHDSDGDGRIDLTSELNQGASINAAKRDRGSAATSPTDFTQEAWDAFREGRHLITQADGDLSSADLATLRSLRDTALLAWERAIAATAVHYVNETIADMEAHGTTNYDFLDHAKHWSELKGFMLALQFDVRHSPMTPAQLADIHRLIRTAPVLPTATSTSIEGYRQDLLEARSILGEAFSFSTANLEVW